MSTFAGHLSIRAKIGRTRGVREGLGAFFSSLLSSNALSQKICRNLNNLCVGTDHSPFDKALKAARVVIDPPIIAFYSGISVKLQQFIGTF
jgi:hypothetical protein